MAYTPSADLLFGTPPAADGNLVFGAEDTSTVAIALAVTLPAPTLAARVSPVTSATLTVVLPAPSLAAEVLPSVNVTAAVTLPGPMLAAEVLPSVSVTLAAVLPGLTLSAAAVYKSYTERPTVGALAADWQYAAATPAGTEDRREATRKDAADQSSAWQSAVRAEAGAQSFIPASLMALPASRRAAQAEAARLSPAGWGVTADNALHDRRRYIAFRQQDATATRLLRALPYQDALRGARRHTTENWQAAAHRSRAVYRHSRGNALPRCEGWAQWEQNAGAPRAGVYTPPAPPAPPVNPPDLGCYDRQPNLLFKDAVDGTGNLLFICDNWRAPEAPVGQIVIPVQRAYIVINDTQLYRVDDSTQIPATTFSVSFDCDSWLPSFSATIPESHRDAVMPSPTPVALAAYINGSLFKFFAEKVTRNRQFGQATVSISGRGVACELGAPFATAGQHTNAGDMTAQQIIDAALQFTGYNQSWGITDWLVPSDTFSLYGTPAEVALAIAEASGSVLQAGRSTKTLRMIPRYPTAPWDWATAAPDIVIPAAVTQTESLEWVEYPDYNAVYVSGVQNGILGYVKRAGTAGDKPAAMFTNPLITHADAARQKGLSILANTGRKSIMQISLPVLQSTGVIDICKLIEFSDGTNTRRGIVRANSVSVNWPTVRQNLTIEAVA